MHTQVSAGLSLGELTQLSGALVEAVNIRLIAEYGSTMSLADVALELGITAVALRIRQSRYGDLPASIPFMKERRWPTPRVARWLCSLGDNQAAPIVSRAALVGSRDRRGPGRPRKLAITARVHHE